MKRILSFKVLFLLLIASIFAFGGRSEAKTVWVNADDANNNLDIYGSATFRYQTEDNTLKTVAPNNVNKTLERLKVQFGATYNANENIETGIRMRTRATSPSPWLDLGSNNTYSGLASPSSIFGLDAAYVKYKTEHCWAWVGKNNHSLWLINDQWWNGAVTPEGVNLGYKVNGFDVTAGYFVMDNSYASAASPTGAQSPTPAFQTADYMYIYGIHYNVDIAGLPFNVAYNGIATMEGATGNLIGGSTNYNVIGANITAGMFTLEGEYFFSGMDRAHINWGKNSGGTTSTTFNAIATPGAGANNNDSAGSVVGLKAKFSPTYALGYYYYTVGIGSELEQGNYSTTNDFAYQSNFTGFKIQFDVLSLVKGLDMDLKYLSQDTYNTGLTSAYAGGTMDSVAPMHGNNSDRRVQADFTVKF